MATTPKDTSLSSAFRYAIDQPLENMATTFQALGMEGWEKFMRDIVKEPENYEAAAGEFINAQGEGFNWEYFPRAIFEQAGQIAGSLATRAGGAAIGAQAGPVGMAVGALLGPALFEAVQIAGPVALERAKNEGREEPNWEDWTGALGTATASGVLNAVGIKNVGVLNSIGKGALKQAGKGVAKAGLSDGVTETLQGATEQIGGSALTAQGLQFDPKAALGEGLLGAGAGTGTQIGTQVLGQVAPPTQDGTLAVNPFTKLFGKKKEESPTPEEVVDEAPAVLEDPQRQARLETAQAAARNRAEGLYPNLIKAYEPSELEFLDLTTSQMSSGNVDAQSFDSLFPKMIEVAQEAGIKEKDVIPLVKRVISRVSNDNAYLTPPEYADDERLEFFDEEKILSTVEELSKGYYDEVKSLRPGMYLNEPKIKGKDIYNKPPLLKVEGISSDIKHPDPYFDAGTPPLGMVKPRFSEEQADILFNSKQGMVEPTLFSYSKFLSPENPLLANFPNKPVPADEALKLLNIQVAPGKGAASHGVFSHKKQKNRLFAVKAIEGKIADFLLNKGKEKVTKQDIIDRYVNHLSGFNGILLSDFGRGVDQDDYTSFAVPDLDERFDRDTYFGDRFLEIVKEELTNADAPKILIDTLEDSEPGEDIQTRILEFPRQEDSAMQKKVDDALEKADERMAGIVSLNSMFFPSDSLAGRPIEPYIPKHGATMQTFSEFRGEGTPELRRLGEDIEVVLNYDAEIDPEGEARLSELPPGIDLTAPTTEQLRRIASYQEEIKRRDPDYYSYEEKMHHWTGPGTVAWMRGGMFSHGPDGKYKNTVGTNMTEIQSGAHGWVQSPDPKYSDFVYKSKVGGTKLTNKELTRLDNGNVFRNALDNMFKVGGGLTAPSVVLGSLLPNFDQKSFLRPEWIAQDTQDKLDHWDYRRAIKYTVPERVFKEMEPNLNKAWEITGEMISKTAMKNMKDEFRLHEKTPALSRATGILNPLRLLGMDLTKEDTDAMIDAWVGQTFPFLYSPGVFVQRGLLDADSVNDPEVEAVGEKIQLFLDNEKTLATKAKKKELAALYKPFFEEALIHNPVLFEAYKKASNPDTLPTIEELKLLRSRESEAAATGPGVTPDLPLKSVKDWARAMVQLTIVKSLMHDPSVTHLYIPTASAGGGPTSPYLEAVNEAEQIAKEFDLDFKKITEFIGQVSDAETGRTVEKPVPVFALEIAPLREMLIEGGGFEGRMQKGGLVKGSSPVHEVLNLGDYGRRFI